MNWRRYWTELRVNLGNASNANRIYFFSECSKLFFEYIYTFTKDQFNVALEWITIRITKQQRQIMNSSYEQSDTLLSLRLVLLQRMQYFIQHQHEWALSHSKVAVRVVISIALETDIIVSVSTLNYTLILSFDKTQKLWICQVRGYTATWRYGVC